MAKPLRVQSQKNGKVQEAQPLPQAAIGDQCRAERGGDLPHPVTHDPPSLLRLLLSGGVLFLIVAGLLGLLLHDPGAVQADPPPAEDSASAPMPSPTTSPISLSTSSMASPTSHPVTPTPQRCAVGETYLTTLRILEHGKQWAAAAQTADAALHRADLKTPACQAQYAALSEKALMFHLQALLAQELDPLNRAGQQQVVVRYRTLQQLAHAAAVSFPTPLAVAEQAKAAGKFLLAKAAFEAAYRAGEFTKADQAPLGHYIDVVYRLGWIYAQGTGAAVQQEGLRLLATSHALQVERGISHSDAWTELRKYCGPDERTWPKPIKTPLLPETP